MNTVVSLIIITVLLNSYIIETSARLYIPDDYNDGDESISTPNYTNGDESSTTDKGHDDDNSKEHVNLTPSATFLNNLYCKDCIENTNSGSIINVCVNYFRMELFDSSKDFYIYEGTYLFNDGELINIICTNTGNGLPTLVTMTYYEWDGNSMKKIFTSTSLDSVQAYIKLLRKNSNSYVDCEFKISVQPVVNTARLSFFPRENPTAIVKVNGLTLSEMCMLDKSQIYLYEYFVNYKENLFLTMALDKEKFYGNKYCKVNGYPSEWHFSEKNSTTNNISMIFEETYSYTELDCFAGGYLPYNIHQNKTFEVNFIPHSHLLENENMVIEGLQWSNIIGIYLSASSTRTVRYLYHGEELQLKCIAYSIPNWSYSDKINFTAINNVREDHKTSIRGGQLYSSTSKFKVKEYYPKVELSCTLSFGHAIVVELIRDETALTIKKPIESINKSTKESSSAFQRITIAVTALVIILVITFTVFKVLKVRNQRKLEQVRIVYGPNNVENIYESIQYVSANSNKPSVDIRKRPSIPLPPVPHKGDQPCVDVSRRPPLPLPLEDEEDNKPYIHYDTPYEYRLFRFGRRPKPPNRGRTLKRIE